MYEVEAVELPPAELESQEWPGSEPAISAAAGGVELVADGPLPYEMRPEGAVVSASQVADKDSAKGGGSAAGEAEDSGDPKVQAKLPGLD
jgi:hypothetical protein